MKKCILLIILSKIFLKKRDEIFEVKHKIFC